jgi:hypothetical protein
MTSKSEADTTPLPAATDAGFRGVFVISSALILATVFGWLACLVRTENGDIAFRWQWRALIWIAGGIGSTGYFWRQVWPVENGVRTLKQQIKGWVVLAVPCVIWMSYPLWFISGRQLFDVGAGLALAATVLTGGGWMVFKLIKGFENDEAAADNADLMDRPDLNPSHPGPNPASPPTKILGRDG